MVATALSVSVADPSGTLKTLSLVLLCTSTTKQNKTKLPNNNTIVLPLYELITSKSSANMYIPSAQSVITTGLAICGMTKRLSSFPSHYFPLCYFLSFLSRSNHILTPNQPARPSPKAKSSTSPSKNASTTTPTSAAPSLSSSLKALAITSNGALRGPLVIRLLRLRMLGVVRW